jgi:hypothetical protein
MKRIGTITGSGRRSWNQPIRDIWYPVDNLDSKSAHSYMPFEYCLLFIEYTNYHTFHIFSIPVASTTLIELSVRHPFIFYISVYDNWIHTISSIENVLDSILDFKTIHFTFCRVNRSCGSLARFLRVFCRFLLLLVLCQCESTIVYFIYSWEVQTSEESAGSDLIQILTLSVIKWFVYHAVRCSTSFQS